MVGFTPSDLLEELQEAGFLPEELQSYIGTELASTAGLDPQSFFKDPNLETPLEQLSEILGLKAATPEPSAPAPDPSNLFDLKMGGTP